METILLAITDGLVTRLAWWHLLRRTSLSTRSRWCSASSIAVSSHCGKYQTKHQNHGRCPKSYPRLVNGRDVCRSPSRSFAAGSSMRQTVFWVFVDVITTVYAKWLSIKHVFRDLCERNTDKMNWQFLPYWCVIRYTKKTWHKFCVALCIRSKKANTFPFTLPLRSDFHKFTTLSALSYIILSFTLPLRSDFHKCTTFHALSYITFPFTLPLISHNNSFYDLISYLTRCSSFKIRPTKYVLQLPIYSHPSSSPLLFL